jgi:hypothetical protein
MRFARPQAMPGGARASGAHVRRWQSDGSGKSDWASSAGDLATIASAGRLAPARSPWAPRPERRRPETLVRCCSTSKSRPSLSVTFWDICPFDAANLARAVPALRNIAGRRPIWFPKYLSSFHRVSDQNRCPRSDIHMTPAKIHCRMVRTRDAASYRIPVWFWI